MDRTFQNKLFNTGRDLSELFSTQPIPGQSTIPWTTREGLERELSYNLGIRDKHICIDGPSGSGKTSLVQRIFFRQKVPFIHIQISKDWEWSDFTRQFVEIPIRTKHQSEATIKGFLNFFRPGLEGGITYKDELDENASFDLLIKRSNTWRSNDLAEWIQNNHVVLIVDDLEMASDSILEGLAACSKLLGQSFNGKIVFVGIDDIMRKIVSRNPSLARRISEVSVGGLSNMAESSGFIFNKFSTLNITTPNRDKRVSDEQVALCREYIYDAANGLMKDLNDLGMSLGREAAGRSRLTVNDFKKTCLQFLQEFRRRNRNKIVGIADVLRNNTTYIDVFGFLISKSASSITKIPEIYEALNGTYDEDEIMSSLEFLETQGILTVTGVEEARVFFKDPPLFNCIKAHLRSGESYGWDLTADATISTGFGQIPLALRGGR